MKILHLFSYYSLRCIGGLIGLFPRQVLLSIGKISGNIVYLFHREFRRKAHTNLAIAFGDKYLEKKRKTIARQSFQSLAITCLEFISLKKDKNKIKDFCQIEGGEDVLALLRKKQGVVFLSAHQANWEIPFLAITSQFPGVAIGRPIKNKKLYRWVLSVRESFGGKIITPKQTIKEGVKALQEGKLVGIVGDQAFPEGSYSYPLFGTRAWTSTAPALLACRTNSPLVAITTKRVGTKYIISGSQAFWPNLNAPLKEEVPRLMNLALSHLEKSIEERPSEWLWQHDRWKQQKIDHLKREFRYAFILIILPPQPDLFLPLVPLFQEIYSRGFLTFFLPKNCPLDLNCGNVVYYEKKEELFVRDFRFQIVFDFYNCAKLRRHFRRLGAFKALNLKNLEQLSGKRESLSETVINAICKENASRPFFY